MLNQFVEEGVVYVEKYLHYGLEKFVRNIPHENIPLLVFTARRSKTIDLAKKTII